MFVEVLMCCCSVWFLLLATLLKSQLVFSLWHFLIHCYAILRISQGVSSKLSHVMICNADFLVKQVPLTNTIQTWQSTWRVVSTHTICMYGIFTHIYCRLALDDFSPSNPSSSLQILNARCVLRNAVEFVAFWMATKESPKVGCRRSASKSTKSSPASKKTICLLEDRWEQWKHLETKSKGIKKHNAYLIYGCMNEICNVYTQ